jgi:dipeptidyl aminopeptidase/acylaminoacyl peptidase
MIKKERIADPAPDVSLYVVTYLSQGLKVKGYLAIPKNIVPCPAMIYCRGGIRKVGMVRIPRIVTLAQLGFVLFAPFYRGNEGGEGKEDFAGEDRYDVFDAIPFIQLLPEVRKGSVAIFGFSRGAMMALLAAKECKEIGPVVVWGGVSDLFLTYEERVDLRRMLKRVVGNPVKQPEEYEKRSPVYWIEEVMNPVLIIHGKEDEKVSVEHALRLEKALQIHKKTYHRQLYNGEGHTFSELENKKALKIISKWIHDHLDC